MTTVKLAKRLAVIEQGTGTLANKLQYYANAIHDGRISAERFRIIVPHLADKVLSMPYAPTDFKLPSTPSQHLTDKISSGEYSFAMFKERRPNVSDEILEDIWSRITRHMSKQ